MTLQHSSPKDTAIRQHLEAEDELPDTETALGLNSPVFRTVRNKSVLFTNFPVCDILLQWQQTPHYIESLVFQYQHI
jgi:hypothetical protein